ncbi:MAG: ABC transporter substrate-binding protein, partial [Firmicutes bacterium]|nr:ABC transporter substrate-binding protein [Bacillota bacterium]
MKKKILALLLCVVMVFGLAACGGGGGTSTNNGSTVVVAMGAGFDTLDPSYCYEKNPPVVLTACYENLFKFMTNDGAAEPMLADTYDFSADGKTLTITLKDATFASGNPVTSEDVKFSIMRVKNLQGNPAFMTDTIASVDTPDEKTVVINLTEPDSAITSKLAYSALAILDSKVVKENGGTDAADAATADTAQAYLNTASAGSGMYVMTSYVPDQEIVLEKNANYWGEGTNVEKYIIKIQPDANTQMMTLASGDLDIALNMTDDTMAELAKKDNLKGINGATKTVGFIMMNMDPEIGGPV